MIQLKRRRDPPLLVQALVLVLLGAGLGVVTDLTLPHGALAQRNVVLRDLEAQVPVRLYDADEAVPLILSGQAILIDARARSTADAMVVLGSLRVPSDEVDTYHKMLIETLAGRMVLVVVESSRSEEARELAGRLVSGYSAGAAGTIEGGWDDLREREDLVFTEETS